MGEYVLPILMWVFSVICNIYISGCEKIYEKHMTKTCLAIIISAILGIGSRLGAYDITIGQMVLKGMTAGAGAFMCADGILQLYIKKTCITEVFALRTEVQRDNDYVPTFCYEYEGKLYEGRPFINSYVLLRREVSIGGSYRVFINTKYPWIYLYDSFGMSVEGAGLMSLGIFLLILTIEPTQIAFR